MTRVDFNEEVTRRGRELKLPHPDLEPELVYCTYEIKKYLFFELQNKYD